MIDFHSHIQDEAFDSDRESVLSRCFESGVSFLVLAGTDLVSSQKAVALADTYKNIFATVAFHPYEIDAKKENVSEYLSTALNPLIAHPKVIGIGECGLDYFTRTDIIISKEQKATQKEGFLAQKEIAKTRRLPLIIHARTSSPDSDDAYQDIYDIIAEDRKTEKDRLKAIVLHCYQGGVSMTRKFLDIEEMFFSFAGNITYPVKNALRGTDRDIQETVRVIPLDRMLTETDSPYLSPQTVRGKRNDPSNVSYVLEEIARIHGVRKEVAEKNLEEVFFNRILGREV